MYEAVTAHPSGDSTVARYAATAASHGYDGLVVRTEDASFEPDTIEAEYDIDIVDAIEIDTDDPAVVAGTLGSVRDDYTIVMVRGGTPTINRYAVEEPRVDVLTAPMTGDGDINHVLAAAAAENGVRIEYRLGSVLRESGESRVQAVSDLRKLREIFTDGDAPYVVSVDARSHLHLRAGRELIAVGELLGFEGSTIQSGLAEWGVLADRNRDRLDDTVIERGVRVEDSPRGEDNEVPDR